MEVGKVKLLDLVEDFEVYPRAAVSPENVDSLVDAIRAGAELPKLVVEKSTLKIVDGLHRSRAYKKFFAPLDPNLIIEVEFREYPSRKELFLDAIKLNSRHGYNLSGIDRAFSVNRAIKFEIDPQLVADALCITVDRVAKFTYNPSAVVSSPQRVLSGSEPLPNKMGMGQIIQAKRAMKDADVKSIGQFSLCLDAAGNPFVKKVVNSDSFAIPLEIGVNGHTSVFEVFVGKDSA